MWPSPWYVTLTLLMTYSHVQRSNKLKLVKLSFFLIRPWPWLNDLDTQTLLRYGKDVTCIPKMKFLCQGVQKLYRLGKVNSNTVNSKFHLIQSFLPNLCQIPIISCLKCTVNSNMVNSKFHQFEGNSTRVQFKVAWIWSCNSKFVLIQNKLRLSNFNVIWRFHIRIYIVNWLYVSTVSTYIQWKLLGQLVSTVSTYIAFVAN